MYLTQFVKGREVFLQEVIGVGQRFSRRGVQFVQGHRCRKKHGKSRELNAGLRNSQGLCSSNILRHQGWGIRYGVSKATWVMYSWLPFWLVSALAQGDQTSQLPRTVPLKISCSRKSLSSKQTETVGYPTQLQKLLNILYITPTLIYMHISYIIFCVGICILESLLYKIVSLIVLLLF